MGHARNLCVQNRPARRRGDATNRPVPGIDPILFSGVFQPKGRASHGFV
jgi:hypothetical protein